MAENQSIDSELRRVGKNTAIYSIGNIGVKVVSFLLIPVYTHYLSLYDVGIIVLLELIEVLYGYVAPLGVLNSTFRFFYSAKQEGREKRFWASNFYFVFVVNIFLLIILILTGNTGARIILSDASLTRLMQIFYVTLFLGLTRIFLLNLLRIYEKPVPFIFIVFIYFLLVMSLNVWFIVGLNLGLWGVVWAKLITSSILFIFAFAYLVRHFGFRFDKSDLIRSLSYGAPMILHGVSLLILSLSDRFLIKEIISVESSGIYGIAYKFGMVMNMALVTPFIQAWQPMLFRLENRPEQKQTYQKTALYFVQIGIILWLLVSVGGKYLIKWTTTEPYHVGTILVPFIAFGYFLYGLQDILKAGALLKNLTMRVTVLGMTAAMLNVILNLFMIPGYGLLGAAMVTVISYLILLLLILNLSQRHFYVNWLWGKMIRVAALGIGIYFLSLKELSSANLSFLKDVLVVILLPVLMIVFRLISVAEIRRFLQGFRK
ncbi:MAG TPA: hypothetical protein ENH29_04025 [Bacteroidetes bacterium]|nr:hypothetical protein [Bacteroidota bacterium]